MFRIAPKNPQMQRNVIITKLQFFKSELRFVPGLLTHQDLCIVSFFTLSRSSFFLFATFLTSNINTLIWELLPFYFPLLMPELLLTICIQARQGLAVFHNQMPCTLLPSKQLVFISVLLGETHGD